MRGDASHQLRPEGWPIFASTDRFQHLTSNFQTGEVCNVIFEEKTTYTDCSYWFQVCMHVHNNGSRGRYDAHFSQLPLFPSVFRAKRLKEEFAKNLPRQKSSWAFSGLGIISHILPISYRAACTPALAFPDHRWKIWESSNCQMVQMADNLSSRANLGRLSISECLSTCILRVTPVARESSWAASGYRSCGLDRDQGGGQ